MQSVENLKLGTFGFGVKVLGTFGVWGSRTKGDGVRCKAQGFLLGV